MSTQFEREIREQPAALARLLAGARASIEAIAAEVRRSKPRFVVTVARGSSDNAARYAKYLFGAHNRLVVSLGAPSLLTLYGAAPALGDALVVAISQSGESPDLVALCAEARRQGALTVALTNQVTSPLAAAAAHVVDLHAGPERAVVASKSYTCQLLALAMLSTAIEGAGDDHDGGGGRGSVVVRDRWRALGRVPGAVQQTLDLADPALGAASIAPVSAADRMIVLGRGFNFATAFELALKIKETSYVLAEAYAAPDLFHGPLAMIDPGFPALVVAPTGAAFGDMTRVVDALCDRRANVIAISDDAATRARAAVGLPLPDGVPEWLSPITAVVPGQLCALALARARGFDPDHPRGLTKVTRTR